MQYATSDLDEAGRAPTVVPPKVLEPGKRAGQFGIFDLLVLMTVAGIGFAIMRLPIHILIRFYLLFVVWMLYCAWVKGNPSRETAMSLAYRRRTAVLGALSSLIISIPVFWSHFFLRPSSLGIHWWDLAFYLILLIGPARNAWTAVMLSRKEMAQSRGQGEGKEM